MARSASDSPAATSIRSGRCHFAGNPALAKYNDAAQASRSKIMQTAQKVLTVGELTRIIKGTLEQLPACWVQGEVASLSRPASGHVYLTLKDAEAGLSAVIWRSTTSKLAFRLEEGQQVLARGKLSVYAPRGSYQLVIEELQPKGVGAAELALRQLKEKLQKLGYFAPERKRPLPTMPRRVALITSPGGAAVRDMLEVIGRRWPCLEAWVVPVRVQGEGAADQIAQAIAACNRAVTRLDVLIVGRGGGSAEDLSAFNAESVATAIYQSRIPVVSAVGHEIDVSIADLVADFRALTPTEAAERVTPDRAELGRLTQTLFRRLYRSITANLEGGRRVLAELAARRPLRHPLEPIRERERKLDELEERIRRVMAQRLSGLRDRLGAGAGRLEALSPLNVLARGYTLTRKETDQSIVRNAEQVRIGERVTTRLLSGEIVGRVEEIRPAAL